MEKGRTRTRRVIPVQVLMVLTTAENAEGEPYNKRKFIGVFPTRDEAEEAGRELDLEELRMEGASLGSTADLFAYCSLGGESKFVVFESLMALDPGRKTKGSLLMGPVVLKRRSKSRSK